MIDSTFWKDRKVLLTGHTGFKGSWLTIWLSHLGAKVSGCALPPPTTPNLFEVANIAAIANHIVCDIRDLSRLREIIQKEAPEIVFHLAAQPLVRHSYENPLETYQTNVIGTLNLLEAIRMSDSVKSCVVVTTDKCYENNESGQPYAESAPLGGYDPYSSSKACAEIVTASYISSFFNQEEQRNNHAAIATARAGNVLGGGDWGKDRLIPDLIKAFTLNHVPLIRNPESVRPWQHVLDPLYGYLLLAQSLYEGGSKYSGAWNFGPSAHEINNVSTVADCLTELWGDNAIWQHERRKQPHEAKLLTLDSSKAACQLGWNSKWSIQETLSKVTDWHKAYNRHEEMQQVCIEQITSHESA